MNTALNASTPVSDTDSPAYQRVNSNRITPKSIDFTDLGGNSIPHKGNKLPSY